MSQHRQISQQGPARNNMTYTSNIDILRKRIYEYKQCVEDNYLKPKKRLKTAFHGTPSLKMHQRVTSTMITTHDRNPPHCYIYPFIRILLFTMVAIADKRAPPSFSAKCS